MSHGAPGSAELLRWWQHAVAALSEGICPRCTGNVGPDGTCRDPSHPVIRYHLCPNSDLATEAGPAVVENYDLIIDEPCHNGCAG